MKVSGLMTKNAERANIFTKNWGIFTKASGTLI